MGKIDKNIYYICTCLCLCNTFTLMLLEENMDGNEWPTPMSQRSYLEYYKRVITLNTANISLEALSRCRWWGVASSICNNSNKSNAIHQRHFMRQERVLTVAKWIENIKNTSIARESILKISESPKGYLLLNNKHSLKKMKANKCK